MRATLALLVALLVASATAFTFEFSGNVTIDASSIDLHKYRETSMAILDIVPGTIFRNNFKSVNIGATGMASVAGDVIYAETYCGFGILPIGHLTYYNGTASLLPNGTLDFSASAASIGGAFLGISEVDASGAIVTNMSFIGTAGLLGNLVWARVENSLALGASAGLNWVTYQGTMSSQANLAINVTFLTTDRVGVVNVASTVVNPRSLESFVSIKGWTYASTSNHLVLRTAVVTGSGSLDGSGRLLSTGTGVNKVYASFAASAVVSGNSATVTVTGSATADFGILGAAGAAIQNAVTAKYGAQASLHVFETAFPAGALDVVWDPTWGQGDQLVSTAAAPPGSSASSLTIASFFVALLALLALLL